MSGGLAESSGKVLCIVEAALIGDLRHRKIAGHEQHLCCADPKIVQIDIWRAAIGPSEQAASVAGRLGDLLQRFLQFEGRISRVLTKETFQIQYVRVGTLICLGQEDSQTT